MKIEIVYTRRLTRRETIEVASFTEAETYAQREAEEITSDLFEEGTTSIRCLPARGDVEAHQALATHQATRAR